MIVKMMWVSGKLQKSCGPGFRMKVVAKNKREYFHQYEPKFKLPFIFLIDLRALGFFLSFPLLFYRKIQFTLV